jgi:hypothetical protein
MYIVYDGMRSFVAARDSFQDAVELADQVSGYVVAARGRIIHFAPTFGGCRKCAL